LGLRLGRPLLLLLAGIALLGCTAAAGPAPSSTTTTISGVVTYRTSGTVTVAVPRLPREFNPLTPQGANSVTAMVMAEVWPQTYVTGNRLPPTTCPTGGPACDSLLSTVGAEVQSVQPFVVRYTIDPGAKWSDGAPITSSDFIYEWQQELTVGPTLPATNPTLGYQEISSISPPAATTFEVTFSARDADWPALFSPLVPAHVAAVHGWTAAFATSPPRATKQRGTVTRPVPATLVSGGPYEIARETYRGSRPVALALVRNPHYWGPPARLGRITFLVEPSVGATLDALARGRVQVAEVPPSPAIDSLVETSTDLTEQPALSPTLEQLVFNLDDPQLVPAVRQAIAESIDRHQLFTNTIGLSTAEGGVNGNRLYLSGAPGSTANDGTYQSVDLDAADSLLTSVGYQVDADGVVRGPTGTPLTLTLSGPTGDAVAASVEQQLQAELLQAGIHLAIRNVSEEELLGTVLPRGRYQMAIAPYLLSPYPSTAAALYTQPVGPTPSALQAAGGVTGAAGPTVGATGATGAAAAVPVFTVRADGGEPASVVSGSVTRDVLGYRDPEIAALFAEASGELNQSAGSGLYNEIDTALWAALPTVPLFEVPLTLVTASDLVGVSAAPSPAGPMWDAQNWAIQTNPPPTTTTMPAS